MISKISWSRSHISDRKRGTNCITANIITLIRMENRCLHTDFSCQKYPRRLYSSTVNLRDGRISVASCQRWEVETLKLLTNFLPLLMPRDAAAKSDLMENDTQDWLITLLFRLIWLERRGHLLAPWRWRWKWQCFRITKMQTKSANAFFADVNLNVEVHLLPTKWSYRSLELKCPLLLEANCFPRM